MVVKGRERERESSQEKGYTLPSMPCGKLTCNIIPVSLCFEREREEYADVRQRAAASRTNVLGQGRPLCVLEFLEERRPQNPVS